MKAPMKTMTAMPLMKGPEKSPHEVTGVPIACKMAERLWLMMPRGMLENGLPWGETVQLQRSYGGRVEKLQMWKLQSGKPWIDWSPMV